MVHGMAVGSRVPQLLAEVTISRGTVLTCGARATVNDSRGSVGPVEQQQRLCEPTNADGTHGAGHAIRPGGGYPMSTGLHEGAVCTSPALKSTDTAPLQTNR